MKKQILFVILEQFADWEAAYLSSAVYMLGMGEYDVKTVSLSTDMVTSIGGFHVVPDHSIESVPSDYEALILIGGVWQKGKSWEESAMLPHFLGRPGR